MISRYHGHVMERRHFLYLHHSVFFKCMTTTKTKMMHHYFLQLQYLQYVRRLCNNVVYGIVSNTDGQL